MKTIDKKTDFRELYNSTIFSKIYQQNHWGGKKGEFYSGGGSHNPFIKDYTKIVADFILKNNINTIIEIGCGDFNVSGGLLNLLDKAKYNYTYTGYDVVKPLIARNKTLHESSSINFICKDACIGKIKNGDLLIIRQVLQHLSNKAIKQIISKFQNYKYIVFTEHQAAEAYGDQIVPNIDLKTGSETRLGIKSGVYLEKEPFNCKIDTKLFSFRAWVYGMDAYINTYLIANKDIAAK